MTSHVPALVAVVLSSVLLSGCGGGGGDGSSPDADRGEESPISGTATGPCSDVLAADAAGSDDRDFHVEPGTEMEYEGMPPVSGDHWSTWEDIVKPVYTADERPDLGQLVHSQEHGWTIVWYDDTVVAASLDAVVSDLAEAGAQKFVFMPWTDDDGEAFPEQAHVAITHWGVEGGETEYRQFCDSADAAAIQAFAERYPFTDSREPNAP